MFFDDITVIPYRIVALLVAVTFHEYAHGRMALAMGDRTAERQGRLTLNPIPHLDPIGSLMILLVGFGWAKPVPVNPYAFRNFREGLLKVSLAGPFANFILVFVALLVIHLFNLGLNLNVLHSSSGDVLVDTFSAIILINVLLGVFNLLPFPPLDGSKVLMAVLPSSLAGIYRQVEPYAPLILIFLIVTRVLGMIIFPVAMYILVFLDGLAYMLTGLLY